MEKFADISPGRSQCSLPDENLYPRFKAYSITLLGTELKNTLRNNKSVYEARFHAVKSTGMNEKKCNAILKKKNNE